MKDDIDFVFDEIARDLAASQQEYAEKVQAITEDRVSKPVGYKIGPKGGEKKIRSKRGEPPRRDTGALMNSIRAEQLANGDYANTIVSVNVPYADPLENSLDRPILVGELEATEALLLDMAADAISHPK